jgi:hypothetical protein
MRTSLRSTAVLALCACVVAAAGLLYVKREDVLNAVLRESIEGAAGYSFSNGPVDLKSISRQGVTTPVVEPKVFQYAAVGGTLYVSRRALRHGDGKSSRGDGLGPCEVVAFNLKTHQQLEPMPNTPVELNCTYVGRKG